MSGDSIYRVGADGSGRRRIIAGLKARELRSSPDGRKLLYTTAVGEGHELWVMNADGQNVSAFSATRTSKELTGSPGSHA